MFWVPFVGHVDSPPKRRTSGRRVSGGLCGLNRCVDHRVAQCVFDSGQAAVLIFTSTVLCASSVVPIVVVGLTKKKRKKEKRHRQFGVWENARQDSPIPLKFSLSKKKFDKCVLFLIEAWVEGGEEEFEY